MRILRANTSVKVTVGPLVDRSDQYTPVTSVDLGNADQAKLLKHDGSTFTDISGRAFSHLAEGIYNLTLSATDANTTGMLSAFIVDTSLILPYRADFMVVPKQQYDGLIGGTDVLQIDVFQIYGNAGAAALQRDLANAGVTGTVSTGSTATVVTSAFSETTDDHFKGRRIVFLTGSLAGQAATIKSYSGASKDLEVSQLTEAPSANDKFVIV